MFRLKLEVPCSSAQNAVRCIGLCAPQDGAQLSEDSDEPGQQRVASKKDAEAKQEPLSGWGWFRTGGGRLEARDMLPQVGGWDGPLRFGRMGCICSPWLGTLTHSDANNQISRVMSGS